MDAKKIREKSLSITLKLGLPINDTLPLLNGSALMRPIEDIFHRLLCLHVVAACSYGFERDKAMQWITSERLDSFMAESEHLFIERMLGDPDKFKIQVESMWALAWFLGLVPYIDFTKGCDNKFVMALPNLKLMQPSSTLRSKVECRSITELLEACDLAYCLHWGMRQVQLSDGALPKKIVPYVVVERRHALDWLISNDDWDQVLLDT